MPDRSKSDPARMPLLKASSDATSPQSFLSQGVAYLFGRVGSGLLQLLLFGLLTHILSTDGYGLYALFLTSVTLLNTLLFHFLRLGVARFLPESRTERSVFLSSIFVGFSAVSVLCVAIGVVVETVIEQLPVGFVLTIVVCTVAAAWTDINFEFLRREFRVRAFVFLYLARSLAALILAGGAAYLGFGARGVVIGVTLSYLMTAAGVPWSHWSIVWADVQRRRTGASRVTWFAKALRFGISFNIAQTLSALSILADRYIVAALLGLTAAGAYAAPSDLVLLTLGLIATSTHLAGYPLIIRASSNGDAAELNRQIHANLFSLIGLALPATVGVLILSPNISGVVMGAAFAAPAALVMPLLALAAFLNGLRSYHFDLCFHLVQRTSSQISIVGVSVILNIVGNLVLIPRLGLVGAAVSTASAALIALCLSYLLGRRLMRLSTPTRDLLKIGGATAVMSVVLIFLQDLEGPLALGMQVGGGMIVYTIVLVLLKPATLRSMRVRS